LVGLKLNFRENHPLFDEGHHTSWFPTDPTGTRAAVPARANSAVEINKDSSEADADVGGN
jgi:hypothetical protein